MSDSKFIRGKRAEVIYWEDLNGPLQEIIDEVCKPYIVDLDTSDVIPANIQNS